MSDPDLTDWEDDTLTRWLSAIRTEQTRRRTLADLPARVEALQLDYLGARDTGGSEEPPEWIQPQGAHDCYPQGYVVWADGKTWVSLIGANVWPPGESGWRELIPDDEDGEPGPPPEFVPPTGAHDAYQIGDRVTYDGQVWVCVVANNVWAPGVHGWEIEDA